MQPFHICDARFHRPHFIAILANRTLLLYIHRTMSLMISISGIRGIVGTSLTPDVVVKYASAFGQYCDGGTIVLGRDGRITGKSIGHIVSSTLLQTGCNVLALGVCPTPTVQLGVERLGAAGGISITASHNPIEWNGLKFISSAGLFLDMKENRRLWQIADAPQRRYAPWNKQGKHQPAEGFIDQHIEAVVRLHYLNIEKLRERRFKVVVDCVNAAGGVVVPKLLRALGCAVIEMNCDVSGIFAHTPEPLPENLTDLCRRVQQEGADLGIAVDPDVDRLVLIDERGQPIGEEYTIASVVRFILEKEKEAPSKTVVINLSTTRAVEDIAAQYGARVVRTPVGEINVAKKMKEVGALVGGEGSGGVILPQVHLGRDALVGIGLTLQHLLESGGTLSELRRSLPQYHMVKEKIAVAPGAGKKILERVMAAHSRNGNLNTDDGVRIEYGNSWVHLRASNTEPIIRVIAEAPSQEESRRLVHAFMKELTS